MKVESFVEGLNADFFTGVPDSRLKPMCDYISASYGINTKQHIIAANEGNAIGIAAGYHLATGKIPVVYMQNSGEGNAVNPITSLLNEKVYAIPVIFVIGWRGEPGIKDEPQHAFQGQITKELLEVMDIACMVVDKNTTEADVKNKMEEYSSLLKNGKQAAFVIREGAFSYEGATSLYKGTGALLREEAIECIIQASGTDLIISTTGKASRELFEARERSGQSHGFDFLTVGSMGHCSSIALGIALNKPEQTVWCVDGDGAALMHLGALPVIADLNPRNFIHIVINNGAHESVGGQPTVMGKLNISKIAAACGYPRVCCITERDELMEALKSAKKNQGLSLIEIKCKVGSRPELGRPTTTTFKNKREFMDRMGIV